MASYDVARMSAGPYRHHAHPLVVGCHAEQRQHGQPEGLEVGVLVQALAAYNLCRGDEEETRIRKGSRATRGKDTNDTCEG